MHDVWQANELIKPLRQHNLGFGVTRALVLRTQPQPLVNYYYHSRFIALGTPHLEVLCKSLLMQVVRRPNISTTIQCTCPRVEETTGHHSMA